MANTTTYEVTAKSTLVRNKPSILSPILTTLTKGTKIEVISLTNIWAYFKYNGQDAYVYSSSIQKVTIPPTLTGNLSILYLDIDTKLPVSHQSNYTNLQLKSYTYNAIAVNGYTVSGDTVQTVSLTQSNPNQTITFWYKKIVGTITVKYIDLDTSDEISTADTFNDLSLTSHTYSSKDISGYTLSGDNAKSVILTEANPNQVIIFTYKKNIVYGSVTVKYINIDTKEDLALAQVDSNLVLGTKTYTAKTLSGYSVVGDSSKSVTLTESIPNTTITFEYKKILGSITLKYIDKVTRADIATPVVFNNLDLKMYTYNAAPISGYNLSGDSSVTVMLTEAIPNRVIEFEYSKILGRVAVQYIHIATQKEIATSDLFFDLDLKDYTYKAKSISGYSVVGDSSKTITLSGTAPVQTVVFEYKLADPINLDQPPYIATRYVTPTFDVNDDVIINFYVTDWNQSDVVLENKTSQFSIEIRLNNSSKVYSKLIGDNSINLGKLPVGEYEFILQATDEYGRKSHELYNEFRVIDKVKYNDDIVKNTRIVTDDDLKTYNISKTNDVANSHHTKVGIQNLINDLAKSGVKKAILPLGIYRVDTEFSWSPGNQVQYIKDPISIPSNFTLDLNGSTFKQNTTPYEQSKALMFSLDYSYDSHIANGIIEGDYGERDISPLANGNPSGEQVGCGTISGDSKYSSYENLTIKKFCGYTMIAGLSISKTQAITQSISSWLQGDINSTGNIDTSISGKYTSDFIDLSKFKNSNIIRTGRYLGYLFNPDGDSWIVKYSFYDASKNYIKTIIGFQYRDIRKPDNASFLRCTYIAKDIASLSQVMVMRYYFPRNCEFKNIKFEDTRTCALAPFQGNNLSIDKCTFTRCATNITPVAIDFEDGWHNMQDYCVQNCEILQPVGTADLVVVGGLGLIFRNNKNWRISSRGCARGQVFTDNNLATMTLGLSTHLLSAFAICKNNTTSGSISNGLGTLSDIKLVIDNCTFEKTPYQNSNSNIIVRDCIFNWDSTTIQYRAPILSGTFYRCTFNNFICNIGHIANFIAYNSTINTMNLEALQGNFILYNCKVNNCSFANYTIDINISINNSIIKDFIINRLSWAKCSISYIAKDNTFENVSVRKNILSDDYKNFDNTKTFKIITSNNTYLNNTILATTLVLNNPNIDKSQMNN